MNPTKMNVLLSVLFFLPLSAAQAASAPGEGGASIAFASGQVQVVSQSGTSDAKAGQALAKGDVLKTGKDSAAILGLSDGSPRQAEPGDRA